MPNPEELQWLLRGKDAWNARKKESTSWGRLDLSEANISSLLEEHQKLTAAGQPDLRGYDLSFVNLSGSILNGIDMSEADLSFADLNGAWLVNGNLTGANCSHAIFTDAHLNASRLVQADLQSTKFLNAWLNNSDFTGAKAIFTDFTGANLTDCTFTDTILFDAQLARADCTGSMLWKARGATFRELNWDFSKANLGAGKKINDVADLLHLVGNVTNNYADRKGSEPTRLYYRGESETFPSRTPSVMRANQSGEYALRASESELLVELTTRRPEDFASPTTALGELMTAQHFGMPTRLLDLTRNPLVALFHATATREQSDSSPGQLHILAVPTSMVKPYSSHTVSVITNFTRLSRGDQNLLLTKNSEYTEEESDRPPSTFLAPASRLGRYSSAMSQLVQYIRIEHPSFEDRVNLYDLLRVFVVEPQQSIERIKAQSGAFLLSAFHERFDEREVRQITNYTPLYHQYTFEVPNDQYTFEVPNELKGMLRKQLESLQITSETMYPGLETAADAVRREYSSESQ